MQNPEYESGLRRDIECRVDHCILSSPGLLRKHKSIGELQLLARLIAAFPQLKPAWQVLYLAERRDRVRPMVNRWVHR